MYKSIGEFIILQIILILEFVVGSYGYVGRWCVVSLFRTQYPYVAYNMYVRLGSLFYVI